MNAPESCKAAAANVLGGKTARACDNCLLKRARWFCAADDAFLCQVCDTAVHSANQLAGRHHRVRLQTASFKGCREELSSCSWHQGFTKKARTRRRPAKSVPSVSHSMVPVVPEINGEEYFLPEEKEEQLFHTVPDSDVNPFVNEFMEEGIGHELDLMELLNACDEFGDLLGTDEEKILNGNRVKVEDEIDDEVQAVIASQFDGNLDMEMNWEFDDYESSIAGEEGEEVKRVTAIEELGNTSNVESDQTGSQVKKRMLLRLNYGEVIDAWASQGCPWENGVRPHFDLDTFMIECVGGDYCQLYGGGKRRDEGEREARVLRYREKRRTRLFSKKIRYQVRKLNAEKRPRMKGRFVKRANFSASSLSYTVDNSN